MVRESEGGVPLDPDSEIGLDEAIAENALIVDVRAPAEFDEDRIPGARNVPLFGDRERSVVGTLYRHLGAGDARAWGRERVHSRLEPFIGALQTALEITAEGEGPPGARGRVRVICCARGGERSAAVTELLRELGHPVRRLRGGYRSYRERVRARVSTLEAPNPVLLDGLTGSGKTAVLRAVEALRPGSVLDLEGLAGHRSSLLGDLGLEPVSQKRFESDLVASVDALSGRWTLIEAESRRIGDRETPPRLFLQMRAAPRIELVATEAQRVAHLRDEYLGAVDVEEIIERLGAFASFPRIGPDGVAQIRQLLRGGEIDSAVKILLREHYDPRYRHGAEEVVPVGRVEREHDETTARRLIERVDDFFSSETGSMGGAAR